MWLVPIACIFQALYDTCKEIKNRLRKSKVMGRERTPHFLFPLFFSDSLPSLNANGFWTNKVTKMAISLKEKPFFLVLQRGRFKIVTIILNFCQFFLISDIFRLVELVTTQFSNNWTNTQTMRPKRWMLVWRWWWWIWMMAAVVTIVVVSLYKYQIKVPSKVAWTKGCVKNSTVL